MTILSSALLLFLVMDPLGNIPLFMTTLKKVDVERKRKVVLRELLIALVIIVPFLGQYLLQALHLCRKNNSMINKTIKTSILLILFCVSTFAQTSAEKGSQIAKDGFKNETVIRDKFNNWRNDNEAKIWLGIIGFEIKNIKSVQAMKPHGKKSDIRVKIKTKSSEFEEGISIKLVSNPKGFNQIDKRWVSDYAKMWKMPEDVVETLRYFVGEKLPFKESKKPNRMYLNELDKEAQNKIVNFFTKNKHKIVSDLLKGRGEKSANWFLVVQKDSGINRWTLEHIEDVIDFYAVGEVTITNRGSLKIGAITMQRKGGDGGRETAKMLQFKLNPAMLFDVQ